VDQEAAIVMLNGLWDTWYTLVRYLRTFVHNPFWMLILLIQPLVWLVLFTQLFQSITTLGFTSGSYVQFFAPGLIVMLAVFNANALAFRLLNDINYGVLVKMIATPVNRYSLIVGGLLYIAVTWVLQVFVVLIVSFLMGARVETGVGGVLMTFLIVSLLGIGLTGFVAAIAVTMKRPEPVVLIANLITLPLMFLSSILIPAYLTPQWIQDAMKFNPVNYAILAVRPMFLTGFDWTAIGQALVVCGVFALVAIFVETAAFRRFGG